MALLTFDIAVDKVMADPNNARKHDKKNLDTIKASLTKFGQQKPIVIDENNIVLAGNGTLAAARDLGWNNITVVRTSLTGYDAIAYALADNRSSELAEWDQPVLDTQLKALEDFEFDLADIGFDLPELDEPTPERYGDGEAGMLVKKFGAPPFSVLDGRQGYWRERKKYWKEIIKEDGESRKGKYNGIVATVNSVSVLDGALAELMIRWFCPDAGSCFDPFAGDTVFGFVAAQLGHKFTGIELRQAQVDINNARVDSTMAHYICDDGQNVASHFKEASQDFLFSCPPYFDLEVYSDLDNDASNQADYSGFLSILDNAFAGAIERLKDERFAVVVIGDVRDGRGFYRGIHDDIKTIFMRRGMNLYNDLILLDPVGTAALRASGYFNAARKVVKVHQHALVFYKGDVSAIRDNFPPIEFIEKENEFIE